MRLVYEPAEDCDGRPLATRVETADSLLTQTRGLMFRRPIPDDSALVFRFSSTAVRDVHMLFVFFPIDVCWVVEETLERIERLTPFTGYARSNCDTIVELPAGGADGLSVGDRLVLEE